MSEKYKNNYIVYENRALKDEINKLKNENKEEINKLKYENNLQKENMNWFKKCFISLFVMGSFLFIILFCSFFYTVSAVNVMTKRFDVYDEFAIAYLESLKQEEEKSVVPYNQYPTAGSASIIVDMEKVYQSSIDSGETGEPDSVASVEEELTEPEKESLVPCETEIVEEETEVEDAVQTYSDILNMSPSEYLTCYADSIDLNDEFVSLCSMIHYEAGEDAPLDAKVAVGNVAMNRLHNQSIWGYNTLNDVIYASGQFNVVGTGYFNNMKERLRSMNWDDYMKSSLMAAHLVYTGSDVYDIPDDVCFFFGDPNKRSWNSYSYWATVGGNSFFRY